MSLHLEVLRLLDRLAGDRDPDLAAFGRETGDILRGAQVRSADPQVSRLLLEEADRNEASGSRSRTALPEGAHWLDIDPCDMRLGLLVGPLLFDAWRHAIVFSRVRGMVMPPYSRAEIHVESGVILHQPLQAMWRRFPPTMDVVEKSADVVRPLYGAAIRSVTLLAAKDVLVAKPCASGSVRLELGREGRIRLAAFEAEAAPADTRHVH